MPRHVVVSPEEELAAFYGGADPVATSGATSGQLSEPLPIASGPAPVRPPAPPPVAAPTPAARPAPPVLAAPPQSLAAPPAVQRPAPPITANVGGVDPIVAAIASLVIPGLGQLLAGQSTKGVVLLVLGLLSCGMGGLLNLVAAMDAYTIAQRRRRGETVQEWQFF